MYNKEDFAPGTVVVSTDYVAKYSSFYASLMRTELPPNSNVHWAIGNDIAQKKNNAIKTMEGEWIWFLDEEGFWDPDCLLKLLHRDVDIVVPLALDRFPPFRPLCYSRIGPEGLEVVKINNFSDDFLQIYASSCMGMLIRKKVLDSMKEPWFEPKTTHTYVNEDIHFCEKARRAGFKIYLDRDTIMGHIHQFAVYAVKRDDWGVEVDFGGSRIRFPFEEDSKDDQTD